MIGNPKKRSVCSLTTIAAPRRCSWYGREDAKKTRRAPARTWSDRCGILAAAMLDGITLTILSVAMALTLWATARVARSGLSRRQKIIRLIACWVLPVIGPLAMLVKVRE